MRHQTKTSYSHSYNYIVTLDIAAHQACLDFGTLCLCRNNCKIFDNDDIVHCRRCQSLEHDTDHCQGNVICKLCAGNHHHTKCCTPQQSIRCINCLRANQNGSTFSTDRTSTYGGCGARMERFTSKWASTNVNWIRRWITSLPSIVNVCILTILYGLSTFKTPLIFFNWVVIFDFNQ